MPDSVTLSVNGDTVTVPAGSTVSAAILRTGVTTFRRSVAGEARGPLCGMGVCFECLAVIDGVPNTRTCTTWVRDGLDVRRQAGHVAAVPADA